MPAAAIVIPCYNEARRLPVGEFLTYASQHDNIHFLFVDDCSSDGTGQVLDELCRQRPQQFRAWHLPHNVGKAGAVWAGFQQAMAGEYEAVGFWDADLATPLAEINHFLTLLADDSYQMVLGSRVRLLGRRIDRQPVRHYLGRIFATLASMVLGLTIYDTQCGAKLFANTRELRQVFAQPFTVNWIFDVEILARFLLLTRYQGAAALTDIVTEYPLTKWLDVPGSKLKLRDFGVAMLEMLKVWRMLRGGRSRQYYEAFAGVKSLLTTH
jgi:glycosyltransferase involved in cell wall biosynthesis